MDPVFPGLLRRRDLFRRLGVLSAWVAVCFVLPGRLAAGAWAAAPSIDLAPAVSRPSAQLAATYPMTRGLEGIASWYGRRHGGRPTASGETHSPRLRTAAHRSLPFGTWLKITNLRNGRTSVVRVNDRGPFVAGRTIDLSEQAARDLAMLDDGLARVRLEVLHDRAKSR